MPEDEKRKQEEEVEVISDGDTLEEEDLEDVAGGDCADGRDGACCTGYPDM